MVLVLTGCRKNHDLLETRLAELELRLHHAQVTAAKLTLERRAFSGAEQELADTLAQFPDEKAAAEALAEPAVPAVVTAPPLPPLPEPSSLEGVEGAKLRAQIAATEAQLRELTRLTAEVEVLEAKQRRVRRQLEFVRERSVHPKP